MTISDLLGLGALAFGLFFSIVGIVGLIRFPDVYCRIHASGKVATLGLVGLLAASAIAMPQTALKALALALFVVITSPVASHAIASAAYRTGVPMITQSGKTPTNAGMVVKDGGTP
jgi:multicomponent Na+:H+ antiporter subunit G